MILLRLISRLPISALYIISDFLFVLGYHLIGYRRKLVRLNLKNSFPEKSLGEIKVIEKEFYKNLCDYAVESLKLVTISPDELQKRMHYTNPEMVFRYRDQNQSVILLSSHQFNWEWLLASGTLCLSMPIDFVYQPIKNKLFDNFMQACRTRFGGYAIKRKEVARELIKRKGIQRGIAIVADQYPGRGNDKKYPTTFLNQETMFFYGSQQMASLTQFPTLYSMVKKIKRGYYTCTLINIAEPPYEKNSETVVENYAKAVERVIREYPSGWLWSHNRWKRNLKKNP